MRPGLTLTGLGMAGCGAVLLCPGLGVLGPEAAGRPILGQAGHRLAAEHAWFWPAVAGAAVSLALIGVYWMFALIRATVLRRLGLSRLRARTRARVRTAAEELIEEFGALPGVRSVRVRLVGSAAWSRLVVSVTCDEDADLAILRDHCGRSLDRLRAGLQMHDLPAVIRFGVVCPE